MKTIVTHLSPDLDAICAIWLIQKYKKGWHDAEVVLVPSGSTLNNDVSDTDPSIIHVDTGSGQFDHHNIDEYTSASRQVYNYLAKSNQIPDRDREAIDRLVEMVTFSDHFGQVYFSNPSMDYYLMFAHDLVHHFKAYARDDSEVVAFGKNILESTLYGVRQKIRAELDLKEGYVFKSAFGRSIALDCGNSQALVLAQKKGYMLVIQRNSVLKFTKIKLHPRSKKSLIEIHKKLAKAEPLVTWFYHPSGKMIINGSAHNPGVVYSKLSLTQIVSHFTS